MCNISFVEIFSLHYTFYKDRGFLLLRNRWRLDI